MCNSDVDQELSTSSSTSISKNMNHHHAVLLPFPVQGQIVPMMQLAMALVTQHGFHITLVNNRYNHNKILQQQEKQALGLHENLHLVWLDDGLPSDYDYSDYTDGPRFTQFNVAMSRMMQEPFKALLFSLTEQQPPVDVVVIGPFCRPAQDMASELRLPTALLWTQPASVLNIYLHLPKLVSNGFFSHKKPDLSDNIESSKTDSSLSHYNQQVITYIPGLPPMERYSFPTSLQNIDDVSSDFFKIIQGLFDNISSYAAILINSFEDLEKEVCHSLQSELSNVQVLSVGPLLPSAFLTTSSERSVNESIADKYAVSLLEESRECIAWLNSKQKQSVLYISFGSIFIPSKEDMRVMAMGIKASKQPFLWVMRNNGKKSSFAELVEVLPEGFLEETKEDGLFITWAPQLEVLSHPSVGAFLTHCGWNSILESLSLGVPLITFPGAFEQPTNSKFVVDIWKVGMSIMPAETRGEAARQLHSEDVERIVVAVFEGEEGNAIRRRVGALSQAARKAMQQGGTSHSQLGKFVESFQPKYDSTQTFSG